MARLGGEDSDEAHRRTMNQNSKQDRCFLANDSRLSGASRRRMSAALALFFANGQHMRSIHLQCLDGGSPGGRETEDADSRPPEVQAPGFTSRVENGNLRRAFNNDDGLSRAFPQRASHASTGEVVQCRWASYGLRHDVVDMEGRFLRELGKQTVFPAIVGALDDRLPQVSWNRHAVTQHVCSIAWIGAAAATANRSSQPVLRLRDVPRPSKAERNPACRATRAAGVRLLSEGAAAPDRRAFRLQTEWSGAYKRFSNATQC